jgi:RNA polymerase sigma-70 factor (ECF subfamily)
LGQNTRPTHLSARHRSHSSRINHYNRDTLPPTHHKPHPPTDEDAYDLQLVEAIRAGNMQAWPALINRYQDRLFSTCLRMVHNRELAADLTQDAFLKVIQHINSFDGRAKLSTWLIRITMNVCLSRLRAEKVRKAASLDSLQNGTKAGTDQTDPARAVAFEQGRELGAASSVESHEDQERVLAALRLLDPDQRAVLILCDCRGLSYEQISEVLGVAVGTVKSRLFRARTALRDAVESLSRKPEPSRPRA